jgi:hypothetical protein
MCGFIYRKVVMKLMVQNLVLELLHYYSIVKDKFIWNHASLSVSCFGEKERKINQNLHKTGGAANYAC